MQIITGLTWGIVSIGFLALVILLGIFAYVFHKKNKQDYKRFNALHRDLDLLVCKAREMEASK